MIQGQRSFNTVVLHLIWRFVFLLVFLLAGSWSVLACMCGKASACERFNFGDAIFVGKAVRVDSGQKGPFKTETTVFEVEEVFSGEAIRTIQVQNKSGFSCDVEFTVGKTYLVFAGGNANEGFGTGFCAGNLPKEFAAKDIAELRKLRESKGDGQLRGTVLEELAKGKRDIERAPINDIRMEIVNTVTGRKYAATTDANGRYEVAVPPGKYSVIPVSPPRAVLRFQPEDEPMKVRSGGCVEGFFVFSNRSLVAGRLIDHEGKPVANARVELVQADETRSYLGGLSADSDSSGEFAIDQIPPGKYTLSLNYNSNPNADSPFPTTFYPSGNDRSAAKIIEIESGSSIEGLTLRLPKPLDKQSITGKVFWEDGSPVAGAEIKLFDMAFPGFYAGCDLMKSRASVEPINSPVRSTSFKLSGSTCDLKSDPTGTFQLEMYSGRTYRITASITKVDDGKKVEYEATSQSFELLKKPHMVDLVMTKSVR